MLRCYYGITFKFVDTVSPWASFAVLMAAAGWAILPVHAMTNCRSKTLATILYSEGPEALESGDNGTLLNGI